MRLNRNPEKNKRTVSWLAVACLACLVLCLASGCGNGKDKPISSEGQEVLEVNPEITKLGNAFVADFFQQVKSGNVDFVASHYPKGEFAKISELKPGNEKQKAMMSAIMKTVTIDNVEVIPTGGYGFQVSFVASAPMLSETEYTKKQLLDDIANILADTSEITAVMPFTIRLDQVEGEWRIIKDSGFAYFITGEAGAAF